MPTSYFLYWGYGDDDLMLGENVTLDLLGDRARRFDDCDDPSRLLKFLSGVFDLDLGLPLSAYCREGDSDLLLLLLIDDIARIISSYCVLSMVICVALALIVVTDVS